MVAGCGLRNNLMEKYPITPENKMNAFPFLNKQKHHFSALTSKLDPLSNGPAAMFLIYLSLALKKKTALFVRVYPSCKMQLPHY